MQPYRWHCSENNLLNYRLRLCQTASKAGKGYSSVLCIQTIRECKSSFDALVSRCDVRGGLEVAFDTSPDKPPLHHSCWGSPVPVPAGWRAFTMSILCMLHRALSLQLRHALCWSSERRECWDEERNCCLSCFMNLSLYDLLLGPVTCHMQL